MKGGRKFFLSDSDSDSDSESETQIPRSSPEIETRRNAKAEDRRRLLLAAAEGRRRNEKQASAVGAVTNQDDPRAAAAALDDDAVKAPDRPPPPTYEESFNFETAREPDDTLDTGEEGAGEREQEEREQREREQREREQRERENEEIENTCPVCYDEFSVGDVNFEFVMPNRFQHFINSILNKRGSVSINESNVDEAERLLDLLKRQPVQLHPRARDQPKHLVCRGCAGTLLSDENSINRSLRETNGASPLACPRCKAPTDANTINRVINDNTLINNIADAIAKQRVWESLESMVSGGKKTKRRKNIKKKIRRTKSRRTKSRRTKSRRTKSRRKT